MMVYGWKTKFKEIRKEFDYSEKDDLDSAKNILKCLRNNIKILLSF